MKLFEVWRVLEELSNTGCHATLNLVTVVLHLSKRKDFHLVCDRHEKEIVDRLIWVRKLLFVQVLHATLVFVLIGIPLDKLSERRRIRALELFNHNAALVHSESRCLRNFVKREKLSLRALNQREPIFVNIVSVVLIDRFDGFALLTFV